MNLKLFTGTLAIVLALGMGVALAEEGKPTITGDYIEARNCDLWTGNCFAMGEINMIGDLAVVAWVVNKGEFEGVTLDGLKVVAALRSEGRKG